MKLKSSQRKSIAAIPTAFKGQERRYAQSVSENLDTLSGRRGNLIDRAVTFRDLLDSGVLRLAGGILSDGGIDVTNPNDPDSNPEGPTELPTKPYNLNASGGFNVVALDWELAPYNGHDYVEIFRLQSDSLSSAEAAGTYVRYYGDAYFYFDQNVGSQETWYYWVRAVNKDGVAGPFNQLSGTSATTALDYVYISGLIDDIIADDINDLGLNTAIEALSDEIEDLDVDITSLENFTGYFSAYSGDSLITRMGSVETVAGNAASSAQLLVETTARTSADSALSGRSTVLESTVNNANTGVAATYAGLQSEISTRASEDSALSQDITSLDAVVNNATTGLPATRAQLQSEITTRASEDSALSQDITTLDSAVNNPNTGLTATRSQLQTEITARSSADTALANRATTLESTVNNSNTGVAATYAGLISEQTTRASEDSALSQDITNLTSTVAGNTSSLSIQASSINGIESKFAVKIDNNGHISGFGLVSKPNNDPAAQFSYPFGTSSFVIAADRFSISAPYNANSNTLSSVPTKALFKVITSQTSILGQTVPSGVYIDDAFIHNAQITNAKIGDAQIDDAKITDLTADKITSGEIILDSYNNNAIRMGKLTYYGPADGFWLGNLNGKGAFNLGNGTNYVKFDGTTLAVTGASITNLSVSTLKVEGEAISAPRSNSGSANRTWGSSNYAITSVPFSVGNLGGAGQTAGVILLGVVNLTSSNTNATSARLRLFKDGTQLSESGFTWRGDGISGTVSAKTTINHNSTHTFYLRGAVDNNGGGNSTKSGQMSGTLVVLVSKK